MPKEKASYDTTARLYGSLASRSNTAHASPQPTLTRTPQPCLSYLAQPPRRLTSPTPTGRRCKQLQHSLMIDSGSRMQLSRAPLRPSLAVNQQLTWTVRVEGGCYSPDLFPRCCELLTGSWRESHPSYSARSAQRIHDATPIRPGYCSLWTAGTPQRARTHSPLCPTALQTPNRRAPSCARLPAARLLAKSGSCICRACAGCEEGLRPSGGGC